MCKAAAIIATAWERLPSRPLHPCRLHGNGWPQRLNGARRVMTGSHTRWARPEAESEDPERIAIREALAFGKAVWTPMTK